METLLTHYCNNIQRVYMPEEMEQRRFHSFHSSMAEKEVNERSSKKQIRQPPSVPFVWEERPGIAKKNWRPEASSVPPALPPPPVKLIVSVPFNWEEMPGKPLSCFSESQAEPSPLTPPGNLVSLQSPLKIHGEDERGETNISQKEGKHNIDLESFAFETDDSFSSTPSTMANCQLSLETMSAAVPLQKNSSRNDNDIVETPSSPVSETESSTSSYATGISSLEGAAFLECLFPLYTPDFGLLGKADYNCCRNLMRELLDAASSELEPKCFNDCRRSCNTK